jgi:predicted RNA-binding Zn-ribbon protein involved in translation (DUF1610 family)
MRRIHQILIMFLILLSVGCVVLAWRRERRSIFVDASSTDRRWLYFHAYKGELAVCFSSTNLPPFGGNTGSGWPSFPYKREAIYLRQDSQRALAMMRSGCEAERLRRSDLYKYIERHIRELEASHTKREAGLREGHAMEVTRCLRGRAPFGFFFKCNLTPDVELIMLLPLWALVVLFSAYPAYAAARWYSKRRRKLTNVCISCGYNLTGNVSGICPECGTEIGKRHSDGARSVLLGRNRAF